MNIDTYFPLGVLAHNVNKELADTIETVIVPELTKLERAHEDDQFTDYFENKIRVHELFPELINEWVKAVLTYQSATTMAINMDAPLQYWTQDYKEGDTHHCHEHGINGISGVYWVRANETAGKLRLHNPNSITQYVSAIDRTNQWTSVVADITPEKGKMVIFPSYVKHEVLPSGTDAIRTTIAFNFAG